MTGKRKPVLNFPFTWSFLYTVFSSFLYLRLKLLYVQFSKKRKNCPHIFYHIHTYQLRDWTEGLKINGLTDSFKGCTVQVLLDVTYCGWEYNSRTLCQKNAVWFRCEPWTGYECGVEAVALLNIWSDSMGEISYWHYLHRTGTLDLCVSCVHAQ